MPKLMIAEVLALAATVKKRIGKTPFNAATRERKVRNIEAHIKRNPRDEQSKTHCDQMVKALDGHK